MDRTLEPYKQRSGRVGRAVLCSALLGLLPALPTAAATKHSGEDRTTPLVQTAETAGEYQVASAALTVTKVRLYFENKRPEITVRRNQPSPAVFAEVEFTGAGLLRGYWEADGRLLSHESRHLVSDNVLVIKTPDSPGLPTFDSGTHKVRFVITKPGGVQPVEAVYFVTAEEFAMATVKLISPVDASEVDYSATAFRWATETQPDSCWIEFFEKTGEQPLLSVNTTTQGMYTLPAAVLKEKFLPGRKYFWKVTGRGSDGKITGESPLSTFSFRTGEK